jgi:hypothetical protein
MSEPEPRRIPVGDALRGIEIYPLPDGETPVSAFVLIKAVDADGVESWWTRATAIFNDHEVLGALISYTDNMRREQAAQWGDDEEAPHDAS